MTDKRKAFVAIAALVATVGTAQVSAAPKPKLDLKPATLRFSWWGGDSRHQATLAAIDAFMKRYPQIKIEGEYSGYEGYEAKLTTQIASVTCPDIMQVTAARVKEIQAQSKAPVFVDFSAYPKLIDLSGFDKSFLGQWGTLNKQVIGLPTGLNSYNFVFNKKLCDAAGISISKQWTYEDLVVEGSKVNKAFPGEYFFSMSTDQTAHLLHNYMRQYAGDQLAKDDYTIGVSKDIIAKAFAYYRRLLDEKVLEPLERSSLYEDASKNPKWIAGKQGMALAWASTVGLLKNDNVQLVAATFPIEPKAKGTGTVINPTQSFTVYAKSKNIEAAVAFLDFLYNDEEAVRILNTQRSVPPVEKARKILADNRLLDPLVQGMVDMSLKKSDVPLTVKIENPEVRKVYFDIIEQVGYGKLKPDAAADQLTVRLSALLSDLKKSEAAK